MTPRGAKNDKIGRQIDAGTPQKSKNGPKKVVFWGVNFLMNFGLPKKSKKEATTISEPRVPVAPGLPGEKKEEGNED